MTIAGAQRRVDLIFLELVFSDRDSLPQKHDAETAGLAAAVIFI